MKLLRLAILLALLSGCNSKFETLPTNGLITEDGAIVRARAYLTVTKGDSPAVAMIKRFLSDAFLPTANAYTGSAPSASVVVTYTNAAQVNFTINTTNFGTSPTITNDILNLGSISLASLSDNKLKVCTSPTKCSKAAIRMYTTGSTIPGFVNTTDGDFGAPVYVSGANPTTSVGLTNIGAVESEVYTIPSNKNTVKNTDFTNGSYEITSDFSNAGAGQYQMTLVIEYILRN